jgi:AraC family transcriptional activator of pobA
MYPVLRFVVLSVRYSSSTEFMDVLDLIDTRKFYKVFYVGCGSSSISINDRVFVLDAGDIIFQRPGDRLSFQLISETGNAYLCLIHTEYLWTHSGYLLDLFRHFPLYLFHRAVISLDSMQSEIVRACFEAMIIEQKSGNPDKKQVTVLQLQMILLQIQRAGRERTDLFYKSFSFYFPCLCFYS